VTIKKSLRPEVRAYIITFMFRIRFL